MVLYVWVIISLQFYLLYSLICQTIAVLKEFRAAETILKLLLGCAAPAAAAVAAAAVAFAERIGNCNVVAISD